MNIGRAKEKEEKKKPQKFRPFSMGLLGVVLALLISSAVLVYHTKRITLFNPNGWITVEGIGSKDADFITRAVIAKIGLFANSKDKTLYFSARPDDEINYRNLFSGPRNWFTLSSKKHYRIEGTINIPASWWSITLYDDRDVLVENPDKRYSFTNYNTVADAAGNFTIDVAPQKPDGAVNWLPAPTDRPFNLKLRIYEPSKELYENIATYPLPKLKEVKGP